MSEPAIVIPSIRVDEVVISDRQRKDLGDLSDLVASIKEYGVIQPLVITPIPWSEPTRYRLVAGERRFHALKKLGQTALHYGVEFIFLSELNSDPLRRSAVELEENLRRKSLSWQEEVNAKAKLLDLMQSIHGVAAVGAATRAESSGFVHAGFGVNKLASMLGQSAGGLSQDLHLARLLKVAPALANQSSKVSALRQAQVLVSIAQMSLKNIPTPGAPAERRWTLYEGPFQEDAKNVPDGSVDLVYSDLPFGVEMSTYIRSAGTAGLVSYSDPLSEIIKLLPLVASESFRVLANNRYAVFWFGWNFYSDLLQALEAAGFQPDKVPFVWNKHIAASMAPHCKYANVYGVALVARKGNPVFIRQGRFNYEDLANVPSGERIHIAQQPVELVQRFLGDMLAPGATVVDFFAGSGTTGVAALRHKCKTILFERDALACAAIRGRMQQEVT